MFTKKKRPQSKKIKPTDDNAGELVSGNIEDNIANFNIPKNKSLLDFKKWELVTIEGNFPLELDDFSKIASNKKPKIFIVGDGHASPPFKYSRYIPDSMYYLDNSKLNLYVEFTQSGWLANIRNHSCQSSSGLDRELPENLMKKKSFLNPSLKANVIPWENEVVNNLAESMYDILISHANDFSKMSKVTHEKLYVLATSFTEEISKYAADLAIKFNKIINETILYKGLSESSGKELINILSGTWRDEYVNKYLANKIAEHANRRQDETFLVSVGDAHLDDNFGSVQQHLIRLQYSEHLHFTHQIIMNKSARLGH
ncbi:hypothetical protein [Enterobacter roggenkampii]|uniref:hypothetical protein n=1 Tax=Enterobacter roggenkampii TaxID=1812935 RepID=UPI00084CC491|nr:hypothetical protein [Enterobacter roggenkampii]AOP98044.1 hypothetical protein BFV67_23015 [Enterobacter roggenkampii]QWZ75351.1 hypothetical protein I6L60_22910 [Enterobacter roggenkampii]